MGNGSSTQLNIKGDAVAEPVGNGDHEVKQGECIYSLAYSAGCRPQKVLNLADNKDLVTARQYPDTLLPGDRVTLPKPQTRSEQGQSEALHSFERKDAGISLNIRLLWADNPRPNVDYELVFRDQTLKKKTNQNGELKELIPPDVESVILRLVGIQGHIEEYPIWIGGLDPFDSLSGVRQRLNNLGYGCGDPKGVPGDPEVDEATRYALLDFQKYMNLPLTNTADTATIKALESVHGS